MNRYCLTLDDPLLYAQMKGWRFITVAFFVGLTASNLAKAIPDPHLRDLVDAANATRKRHVAEPFAWTATWKLREGNPIVARLRDTVQQRRIEFWIARPSGDKTSIATLTIADGVWYLRTPLTKPAKYRPYEAPMPFPFLYNLMPLMELQFVDQNLAEGMEFLGATNGVVEVAIRSNATVDGARKAAVEMLAELDSLGEFADKKQTRERLNRILENGWKIRVDQKTGLLLQNSAPDAQMEFSDFEWTREEPEQLRDTQWIDFTEPVAGVGSSDLIMALYRTPAGAKVKDSDGFVLDLRSRGFRRIAAQGGESESGCFLPGRTSVVAHVQTALGSASPFVIDLVTGENKPFGPAEVHGRFALSSGGSLSPDGKEVVIIFKTSLNPLAMSKLYAIDIKSNAARKIGPDDDYMYALWFSNSKDLLVERLKPSSTNRNVLLPEVGTLRNGEFRPIGMGQEPCVLDNDRVLYSRAADDRWIIVDKNGRHEKAAPAKLDGRYGAPTSRRNSTTVIMMKFGESPQTTPTLVNLATGTINELQWPKGLWGRPVWDP